MHTVAELESLIEQVRAEFSKACDEGKTFYEKKEIQQRLKEYLHELKMLEYNVNPNGELDKAT